MDKDVKERLEHIRKEMKWPNDDVLLVIHTNREQLPQVVKALESVGLKDNDGVELVPLKH